MDNFKDVKKIYDEETKNKKVQNKQEKINNRQANISDKRYRRATISKFKKKEAYPEEWEQIYRKALASCVKEIKDGSSQGHALINIRNRNNSQLEIFAISHFKYLKRFLKSRFKAQGFKHVRVDLIKMYYISTYDRITSTDDELDFKNVFTWQADFVQISLHMRTPLIYSYQKINHINYLDDNYQSRIYVPIDFHEKTDEKISFYRTRMFNKDGDCVGSYSFYSKSI